MKTEEINARRMMLYYMNLSADHLECVVAITKHLPKPNKTKVLCDSLIAAISLLEKEFDIQTKELKKLEEAK